MLFINYLFKRPFNESCTRYFRQANTVLLTQLIVWLFTCFLLGLSQMAVAKMDVIDASNPSICSEIISTQSGLLQGFSQVSRRGNAVCGFRGVPYAEPPVGDLRWRAPRPLSKRENVLVADTFKDDCVQNIKIAQKVEVSSAEGVSEDCLGLNIWRPSQPGKYPVMVWFHGGGFLMGSGAWPTYDGINLADQQDVVVVTVNYRLNLFGFLAHEALVDINDGFEGGSAGNYGFLDQQMALQWVQDNIGNFSGDPNNVTIFGESAGGWSVFSHIISPLSKGLFHKAIVQSGGSEASLKNPIAFDGSDQLSEKADCLKEGATKAEIAKCLRSIPTERIYSMRSDRHLKCITLTSMLALNCYYLREDGVVIPEMPYELIKKGDYNKVPILAGYNRFDFPFLISSTQDTLAVMQGHPIYLYEFHYKAHALDYISALHGMELPYVFDTRSEDLLSKLDDGNRGHAEAFTHHLQSYWGNFAKTGNPNGKSFNGEALLEWPEYSASQNEAGVKKPNSNKNILRLINTIQAGYLEN